MSGQVSLIRYLVRDASCPELSGHDQSSASKFFYTLAFDSIRRNSLLHKIWSWKGFSEYLGKILEWLKFKPQLFSVRPMRKWFDLKLTLKPRPTPSSASPGTWRPIPRLFSFSSNRDRNVWSSINIFSKLCRQMKLMAQYQPGRIIYNVCFDLTDRELWGNRPGAGSINLSHLNLQMDQVIFLYRLQAPWSLCQQVSCILVPLSIGQPCVDKYTSD